MTERCWPGGPLRSRAAADVDILYASTPPWDIGRPQQAFRALAESGAIEGRVLDVGCGTGEHTLMAAERGLEATGIDLSKTALEVAEGKARARGIAARFLHWDALQLGSLGELFDTVMDCGLFHTFPDGDCTRFVESLGAVLSPGGRYFMLCFSDRQPGAWGPHRRTKEEIRSCFADGWQIDSIEPSMIEVTIDPDGVRAWLALITRS